MGRSVTITCNNCGNEVEQVAGKLYLAPVIPGRSSISVLSGYSHYGDLCGDCLEEFVGKLDRRKVRVNGNSKKEPTKAHR